jgi:hypothetical protein
VDAGSDGTAVRFSIPALIQPDGPICGIRLSDRFHRKVHGTTLRSISDRGLSEGFEHEFPNSPPVKRTPCPPDVSTPQHGFRHRRASASPAWVHPAACRGPERRKVRLPQATSQTPGRPLSARSPHLAGSDAPAIPPGAEAMRSAAGWPRTPAASDAPRPAAASNTARA